ncbi:delta(3,5)-Delta(2,4)-dienoyl-CoA isomerase, mitochondrial-like [Zophobas morio]|uniref:delta(3,5)-Delta(2,4)-dienoyl-CoA isomerase, mitochondrial-like n=1 Tax=Zophobas morio TaxID=2755281 RepID=UPI003082CCA9
MLSTLVTKPAFGLLFSHLKTGASKFVSSTAKMSAQTNYETLAVTIPHEFVYHVELNRPEKLNAMNITMWSEIGKCFENLDNDENCRVVVLSAAGKIFTAGLDFKQVFLKMGPELADLDVARKAKVISTSLRSFQKSITSIELCKKPVLTAIHSACVGGGLNLIAAADIRYCSKDAWFQLKEVDIGMAADVGALQRLPKIMNSDSFVRELCYTARKVEAPEALSSGLVSRVFEDKESLIKGAIDTAQDIAKKSPVAVQTTKVGLVYARDHSVQDGLDQIASWNQLMLQSEDFMNAVVAQASKQKDVVFSKL